MTDGVAIASGSAHTCAIRASGSVVCWGANDAGQLGDARTDHGTCSDAECRFTSHIGDIPSFDCSAQPVAVVDVDDAIELAAGYDHTCARRASGSVVCWGGNAWGQLGDGTTEPRARPVVVTGLVDAVGIGAGEFRTCARLGSGAVMCWGSGLLGDGLLMGRPAPTLVVGLADAVQIGVGAGFACARRSSGSVMCWGDDDEGQLGSGRAGDVACGSDRPCALTPVVVAALADASSLGVGGSHACAIQASGGIACWGSNGGGELGDGERAHPTCTSRLRSDCSPWPVAVRTPPPCAPGG